MRIDRVRDVAPMLHWLLEMLVCLQAGEGLDVLLRPGGDRRREIKLHLPACDRAVLEQLLEMLRGMGGEEVEPEQNPGMGPEVSDTPTDTPDDWADTPTDDRTLTPLDTDILRVLTESPRPLTGKAIARRLGRKYGSWVRERLACLVRAGRITTSESGYQITRCRDGAPTDAPTDNAVWSDGG